MRSLFLFLFSVGLIGFCHAADPTLTATDAKGRAYEYVANDPLQARIYTLKNGLKVYLSVNKAQPRLYTCIAVRAGSKHDPPNNTGLAHYLEHLLFKGTTRLGSQDYSREKPFLDEITRLYEERFRTTDSLKRARLYEKIDSVSQLAAQHALPNEYDKLVAALGATGTNAFTGNEQTVYINDVPSNALHTWLELEAERFRNPVFRLFHTELEVVYEEKNRAIDSDQRRASELMMERLFPTHNYGQQTTLGSTEHLKNPSIRAIEEYYRMYYVPNNMALCLAGDLDPEQTMDWIEATWGDFKPGNPKAYVPPVEKPITKPIEEKVVGPTAASVQIGFRVPGVADADAPVWDVLDALLANGDAGLIDLNLNQAQKVLSAGASLYTRNDYASLMLQGRPKEGQSLQEVRDLLLDQVKRLAEGNFPESMIAAVVRNSRRDQLVGYRENSTRAFALMESFTSLQPYSQKATYLDRLARVTKADVVRVAKTWLKPTSYVCVYKEQGPNPDLPKIAKPPITPVEVERNEQSALLAELQSKPRPPIEPRFLDLSKAVERKAMGINELWYSQNTENDYFTLYYHFAFGNRHDRMADMAVSYLDLLGTGDLSAAQFSQKLYELGCRSGVSVGSEETYVYLSGLKESCQECVKLFEQRLRQPRPDAEALKQLVGRTLKSRADAKLNKGVILQQAMYNYAVYGPHNPFTARLSEKELNALKPADLTVWLQQLPVYSHRVLYYGPEPMADVESWLNRWHVSPAQPKPAPKRMEFAPANTNRRVFFVDYEMVQAEILLVGKSIPYRPEELPYRRMYSEYFGGGMSSIVFQDLREAKGLAYTTYAGLSNAHPSEPLYSRAYIGTQADKLKEAIGELNALLVNMPQSPKSFEVSREAVLNTVRTERSLYEDVFFRLLEARRNGYTEDPNAILFRQVPGFSLEELTAFQEKAVAKVPHDVLVIGKRERLDIDYLRSLGQFQELKLEDIFGY